MRDSSLDQVAALLAEMPGIGKKTAQRLAYFVLGREERYAFDLADALRRLKQNLRWCARCHNVSENELCEVCRKPDRDAAQICVVEEAANVSAIERSGGFRGYYHVLQGALSPVNGIGPDDLTIKQLLDRLAADPVGEVILATNPTVEGEATAMYIAGALETLAVKVSRIGVGVPIGGSLDYCDEITMAKAFENRRPL